MNIQETIAHVARFTDPHLIQDFSDHLDRDRIATVDLLIRVAEIDERKLFRPADYSSTWPR